MRKEKILSNKELEEVIQWAENEHAYWIMEADHDPMCEQNRDAWAQVKRAVLELQSARAQLADLRRDFAALGGVDVPETGEGE